MIRPYLIQDKDNLIELIRLNTPRYFAEAEVQDFAEYLEVHLERYFVLESEGKIVGSGGINYFPDEATARLSWDVIHPDVQGQGFGRELTLFRINEVKRNPAIHTLVVRTSQLVYPFYEKMGFVLEKMVKDYWADGLDLYQMKYVF